MNTTLFKANVKNNLALGLFITCLLLLYTTISVGMFDPINAESMESMLSMMPEGMVKALGFDGLGTELTGYLGHYLYGFIYLVFPIIFTIITSNKLIAKHVDSGSMTYLLTTPHTRKTIARTQAIYLAFSSFMIIAINTAVAIAMSQMMFKGLLDIPAYLGLSLVTYLCIYVIGAIGFFFSCLFNDVKNSLSFGAVLPILFVVLKMVSAVSEETEFLKYFSLYSVIDVNQILTSSSYTLISSAALLLLGTVIYVISIELFDRRSLSL